MANYIIEYRVLSSIDAVIKTGKIRCKNKDTEFQAKVGLDNYLKRTVPAFSRLIIISCTVEKNKFDLFDFLKS